jgi:hypothetical protein
MSGFASGDVGTAMMWRRGSRVLALCAVSAALSGCYYYVPPSTQVACVPASAPNTAPAPSGQQPAANGCPPGSAAGYVQTPGYTAPYYGYPYYGYGYPYYGYPYGYYGWPGYAYGPTIAVGWGWGGWGWHGGWGWRGGGRWR